MVKGALAFIATPIGAVIAALGLAIGALTAYFKGSEEGQDNLTRVMNIGKVVFNGFMVVVEKVT
jgi:zinc transporter ZupT